MISKSSEDDNLTVNVGGSTIGQKDGYASLAKTFGDFSFSISASGVDSDGNELDFDFYPGALDPDSGVYGATTDGKSDGYKIRLRMENFLHI